MITLYDYELSGNCYKLRLLMGMLGVAYKTVPVDFYPGREHKSDAFLRINPLGQLPVIDDDGLILRDAQAILVYLAAKYDPSGTWCPRDNPALLGEISQWLAFADAITGTASAARLHDALFYDLDVGAARAGAHRLLRKGKVVATLDTVDTSPDELARLMVGRDVSFTVVKPELTPGPTVVAIEGLTAHGNWGEAVLKDISFSVARHEILGIAGVAGNGQKELFEVLCGVRKLTAGTIRLHNEDVAGLAPRGLMDRGIGHIPDDRFREGLVPEFSIAENLVLGWQRSPQYRTGPLINGKAVTRLSRELMGEYQIAARNENVPAGKLSGGNAQKIIIAREFLHSSDLMLANQPTRGLDVGVIEYVQSQLLRKRAEGSAIILASEELSDLFGLADRIAVMFKGEIMGIVDPTNTTITEVGAMMAGHRKGAIQ